MKDQPQVMPSAELQKNINISGHKVFVNMYICVKHYLKDQPKEMISTEIHRTLLLSHQVISKY